MTTPDIDLILDRWFSEGTDVLPDRSVEAVLRTVDRTAQRRAWRVPWRTPFMNGIPRLAALAGATLIVVLVAGGLVYLGGTAGPPIGAQPTPTPTRSPEVTASPIPSPVVSATPLGLAIVEPDGMVRQDLGMPADAWMADLSADGHLVIFTTANQDIGFCGGCVDGVRRSAIVEIRTPQGGYFSPTDGPDTGTYGQFAWSPSGDRFAFQAADESGNLDLYVATTDEGQAPTIEGSVRRLTTDPAVDEHPSWSPDGSTIVYGNLGAEPADDSGFSPTQEIWSVPAAGGTPRRLTTNDVADTQPDVSADGTIAYWSQGTIMAMDSDGTNVRALAEPVDQPYFGPRWSPDGTKIAALRYDPSERARLSSLGLPTDLPLLDVVVIDLATGGITEVGPRVASDRNPASWTPDGQALLINRYDAGAASP